MSRLFVQFPRGCFIFFSNWCTARIKDHFFSNCCSARIENHHEIQHETFKSHYFLFLSLTISSTIIVKAASFCITEDTPSFLTTGKVGGDRWSYSQQYYDPM
uniref:Uncharacterized protein n=1 Tax=Ditylum brightwellii TaxID=49249 RepID=A0A7S1YR89_9STRA|mmetsp:Transcript_1457/g.2362  ORF Transcript_1457/g.2362 Transcript_1457/m.2362 type:complete len:102 (+) Transcript_1457:107-412(+)